ncbi:GtrA family protein [Erythrobacter litoralis]|uniref:GtrA family protein n=1 Tax=Erythrobacter litoralis TaxID=39960 RepID=UPI0024350031|nr:GtrA family protein [Erythrobacter litoralis]MDG6078178.1 GtrA family protein [Erythrobacter litoralis]
MLLKLKGKLNRDLLGELTRFAVCGVANTATCFVLLFVLTSVDLNVWLASFFSYGIATVQSFFLNKSWTFRAAKTSSQFTQFVLLNVVSALVFSSLTDCLTSIITLFPAAVFATGVSMLVNFVAMKLIIFKKAAHV